MTGLFADVQDCRVARHVPRRLATLWAIAWLVMLLGCATHADRIRQSREAFYQGDLPQAAVGLEEQLEEDGSDRDVVALDWAMTQLLMGQPERAERTLREVRDRFDYLEQESLAERALSAFTDDNRRAYSGEDYEKVLIRVMLAMCSLMGDGQDAEAYCLQVNAKQQQIIDAGSQADGTNPKLAYKRVAMGAYLNGALREATHSNYDDVERSFAKVVSWQPDFAAGNLDLQRARQGVHSAPGNGVLYVFALVGRGPFKQEVVEAPTSGALLIADRILSATSDYTLPPTLAPIKVPQVVVAERSLDHLLVSIDHQACGETQTVTDVGQLAVQQYQAIYPHVMARAVVRRVLKKAAIYSAKSQLGSDNGMVDFAFNAAGVVWEASESADTRCWALLPDTIQVLRVELPAGSHRVSLHPMLRQQTIGSGASTMVHIENGRSTYLLSCFPGPRPAGQILVATR
jgi:hypothetical protein